MTSAAAPSALLAENPASFDASEWNERLAWCIVRSVLRILWDRTGRGRVCPLQFIPDELEFI
jgi:hypothetical protein